MAFKKPFKITVINLSEKCKGDSDAQEKLFARKVEIDCLSQEATRLIREAQVAAAKAQIALAQKQMTITSFLVFAGEIDGQIAREDSAMAPYTNAAGDICVDIPFTQREQRMAVRAAHKQLAQQANEDPDSEMYDDTDDTDGNS